MGTELANWPMMSIHKRLLLWLLVGLLIISTLAGIATYRKMLEEINEMQNFELRQIAYAIEYASRSMSAGIKTLQNRTPENPEFLVQIWREGSRLQYSSHPSVALPLAGTEGLSEITLGDEQWQVFKLIKGERIVQTAQSVEDRQDTAGEMVMQMFAPFLLLIPALAWLAWLAVRKGLAPLGQITADIRLRDSSTMQPLDERNVPEEIRPLITALNDLLERLDHSLNAQRQFVAVAAHELRTPLTALSLQAQLVQKSKDESERSKSIRDLRQGITRASHLVQQLLDLARQEPDSPHSFSPLDLSELVRNKVGEMAPLAADNNIDLGVAADHAQWINGDADSLQLLVGNLIDNAIRYTPEGGQVDVSVNNQDGMVVLTVADNGAGIPVEDRTRIFERFYRPAGQSTSGSGLGLAIVRQVAGLHKADVQLEQPASGLGSVFHVTFYVP